MKILMNGDTLVVHGFNELHALNSKKILADIRRMWVGHEWRHLELDVSGLQFIDSHGLSVIIAMCREARQRGGELRLADPSPFVLRLLDVTRLSHLVQISRPNGLPHTVSAFDPSAQKAAPASGRQGVGAPMAC